MAPPYCLIYAELLLNIRQISVLAVLETPCNTSTKAKLSDDGQQFILLHNGRLQTLHLPGKSLPNFRLQFPVLGSIELSWRIPWAAEATDISRYDSHLSDVPWSAKCMDSQTELTCRVCNEVILERGTIKIWKDLPSEDWAEMMDFWHCHKPDDHKDGMNSIKCTNCPKLSTHNDCLVERAYGANSKISAQPGVGLVDITTFLLRKEDCSKIQIEKPGFSFRGHRSVKCLQCQTELGYYDTDFLGIKFYKWRIQYTNSLNPDSLSSSASPSFTLISSSSTNNTNPRLPASIFVMSKIISQMASHLVTKFLLTPTTLPRCSTKILLWIFGASLRFSSSRSDVPSVSKSSLPYGQPAIKVFWKVVSGNDANNIRDNIGIEEVFLPSYVISEIEDALTSSSVLLPACSQKYQEWNVGLLERYEE
ncbi:hypothetical protein EPUL_004168 [Erysiphe pulchra]|uniref:Uncharacterized protein n=1 Tax=Erysiphe pulchra TaxID=225359 RepID=A0A2S4PPB9_9PEZI|nr:hypothetical protein EPUL_004168 [Erysiphe pulchra]